VWRPRASSIGYYYLCQWRAAADRAIAEGYAEQEIHEAHTENKERISPYADLGTIAHWLAQTALAAQFPGLPEQHKYTSGHVKVAASLFGGQESKALTAAAAAAGRAVRSINDRIGTGRTWLAEVPLEDQWGTGHCDLMDDEYVCDFKFASRAPSGPKFVHILQLLRYHIFTGRPKGALIYADMLKDTWGSLYLFDFTEPRVQDLCLEMRAFLNVISDPELLARIARPTPGDACDFCPYSKICPARAFDGVGSHKTKSDETVPTAVSPLATYMKGRHHASP
jgi:hypothetical protein